MRGPDKSFVIFIDANGCNDFPNTFASNQQLANVIYIETDSIFC